MRRFRATPLRVRNLLASVSIAALIAAQSEPTAAHTVSIGYAFSGPGSVTFWYGSYHSDATFNEADLRLVGPSSYNSTINFNLLSSIKPSGLIDGTNNFYSNTAGTALVGVPEAVVSTDGSGGHFDPATDSILNWQGVQFTGLRPGTYTFTYNPLAVPTVEWHPINAIIETNTFTLTAQDILGIQGYRFYGTNVNQRATGAGLDTAIDAGGYNQRIYNIAALSSGAMANALTQLSGEVHTQSSRVVFQSGTAFMSAMMDPFAGGMRGGTFGPAPFDAPYGSSPYGAPGNGNFGPGGANPYGAPYNDPQSGNGSYGPGGVQYGDPAYGNPYNANSPYGNSAYGNSQYGNSQYGASPYGNGANGNSPYGNGANGNSPYGYGTAQDGQQRGLFQKQLFENQWSLWATTYGGYSHAAGDATIGSHDTGIATGGMIAGADYRFGYGSVLGFAMGGGVSAWSLANSLGTGKSDDARIGIYGSQPLGQGYVSGALASGWHWMSTDRTITIDSSDQLRSRFTARSTSARVETGYRLESGGGGITPHIALQNLWFSAPAYSETVATGANDYALDIAKRNTSQLRTETGAWFDRRLLTDAGPLSVRWRLAWVHEQMAAPTTSASFQTLPGSDFNVIGAAPPPDRVLTSVGAEVRMAQDVSLSGKFDGEFGKGFQNYVVLTTLRYQW